MSLLTARHMLFPSHFLFCHLNHIWQREQVVTLCRVSFSVFLSTCSDLLSTPVLPLEWGTMFQVCMKQHCKLTVVSLFIYFWGGHLNEYIIKEIKIEYTKIIQYYIKNVFQVITETHLLQEFPPFLLCALFWILLRVAIVCSFCACSGHFSHVLFYIEESGNPFDMLTLSRHSHHVVRTWSSLPKLAQVTLLYTACTYGTGEYVWNCNFIFMAKWKLSSPTCDWYIFLPVFYVTSSL